jgi:L-alanine-DL-glutamate epimerase-like enolase superfamily enzyme
VREDDLIVEPLEIKNGRVSVPQRPDLGVDLDLSALEKCRAS